MKSKTRQSNQVEITKNDINGTSCSPNVRSWGTTLEKELKGLPYPVLLEAFSSAAMVLEETSSNKSIANLVDRLKPSPDTELKMFPNMPMDMLFDIGIRMHKKVCSSHGGSKCSCGIASSILAEFVLVQLWHVCNFLVLDSANFAFPLHAAIRFGTKSRS